MRSRITTVAIALALLGAFVAPAGAAQAASATVSGVVEYRGEARANILVGWFVPTTGAYKTVKSSANGSYSLALPQSGSDYVLFGNMQMQQAKQLRGTSIYVGVFYGEGDERDYAFQTLTPYTATAEADVVDIDLAKPGSIYGQDTRLRNAHVQLEDLGGNITSIVGLADSTGRFDVKNLVPGQYRLNQTRNDNHIAVTDEVITVSEGSATKIDPKAVRGGRVEGVVRGANGKPIAGVTVSDTLNGKTFGSDQTDSKGRYLIKSLSPGRHRLHFSFWSSDGSKGYQQKSVLAPAVVGEASVTQNATLSTGGRIIVRTASKTDEVRVIGPDGIQVFSSDNYSQRGSSKFTSLRSGTYKVYSFSTSALRSGATSVTVAAGKTIDFTLAHTKKAYVLKGHVPGGLGDENRAVIARTSAGFDYAAYPDDNGDYRIAGLIPGTYSITVTSPGYSDAEYTQKMSANLTRDFARGAKFGKVSVAFSAAGSRLDSGRIILETNALQQADIYLEGGRALTAVEAGNYSAETYFDDDALFQAKSPYWAELPSGTLPVSVKSAKTTYLGVIPLEIH